MARLNNNKMKQIEQFIKKWDGILQSQEHAKSLKGSDKQHHENMKKLCLETLKDLHALKKSLKD